MGFTEKTPQYKACLQFIEAISPKNKTDHTEVVNLISPPVENEPIDTSNEILFIKAKPCQDSAVDNNKKNYDDEEHESHRKETAKHNSQSETGC